MKFIKETNPAIINNQRVRQGLFECPVCTEHVEKRISHGKVNKTCGSKTCKAEALSAGQSKRTSNGDARRTHGLSGNKNYVPFRKMWKEVISLDSTWLSHDEFLMDMFTEYCEFRTYAKVGRTKLLKRDTDLPHSKDNSYFDCSDNTKEAIRLDAMSWTGSNTVKLGSELSANFEIVNTALMNAIANSDLFDKLDFNGISPRTKSTYKLTDEQKDIVVDEILKLKGYTASDKVYIVSTPYIVNGEVSIGYKLGISHDIDKRLSTLKNANPNDITLVFGSDKINFATTIEKYLHAKYSEQNIHREWFTLSDSDISDIISDLTSESPVKIAMAFFNDVHDNKAEKLKAEAIKQNLCDTMIRNVKKLDKTYNDKQLSKSIIEKQVVADIPASEHKRAKRTGRKYEPRVHSLKAVYQFKLDGTLVAKHDGITIAQESTGINHIGSVCNGKRKHAGGFLWSFNDSCEPVTTIRKAGIPIDVYKDGLLIDTLDSQKEVVSKYEVSNSTLKRRLGDGKPIGDLTFKYQE
jgi:hypothetical protein